MLKTGLCPRSADTSSEASASTETDAGKHLFSLNGSGWKVQEASSLHAPRILQSIFSPRSITLQAERARSPGEAIPVSSPFSSRHSFQHPQPPGHLEWGRRHSEPLVTLPGPLLGLTRRGSEPTYLPSEAVGWGWGETGWGTEPGLERMASKNEELGGSSWKCLFPSCESSGALQVGTSGI